jgi:hypothetical protein
MPLIFRALSRTNDALGYRDTATFGTYSAQSVDDAVLPQTQGCAQSVTYPSRLPWAIAEWLGSRRVRRLSAVALSSVSASARPGVRVNLS